MIAGPAARAHPQNIKKAASTPQRVQTFLHPTLLKVICNGFRRTPPGSDPAFSCPLCGPKDLRPVPWRPGAGMTGLGPHVAVPTAEVMPRAGLPGPAPAHIAAGRLAQTNWAPKEPRAGSREWEPVQSADLGELAAARDSHAIFRCHFSPRGTARLNGEWPAQCTTVPSAQAWRE